jgi:hypothetical protein
METQNAIERYMSLFTESLNDVDFLNNLEDKRSKEWFLRQIKNAMEAVARQKAIDIKNSISTL